MYKRQFLLSEKRGIVDERAALWEALGELEKALSNNPSNKDDTIRLLSSSTDKPHLGDLSVYGVLRGLEGLEIHEEIVQDAEFVAIAQWYATMKRLAEGSTHASDS